MSAIDLLWKHPTPHEQSLAQYDEFMSVPVNRFEMQRKAMMYGGTARNWALKHLRIWAAILRIRERRNDVRKGLLAQGLPNAITEGKN